MIDNFHEKRSTDRRKNDADRDFLIKMIKTCLRMNNLETLKEMLSQTVDFVENGESKIREIIKGGV